MKTVLDAILVVESAIKKLNPASEFVLSADTPLLGSNRVLDSMNLIELCLELEDAAATLGFAFDWTSSNAMSKSSSMFRTIESLAKEFFDQMNNGQ
jgi:hypothetical protein